jgi:hypothetical protein
MLEDLGKHTKNNSMVLALWLGIDILGFRRMGVNQPAVIWPFTPAQHPS